ncbi:Dr1-associated corepressor [Melipona quadrifasciata]|uniref:Dr1-associated corepressor n=1 Tax=Melipona quadrifasciata TaxID=166423 RepID=A0A0N0U500_9HYME|nr:Dr1-associated corepressor [Melipona quadrifasciata]
MPSKKKKYNARFPAGRIKKIMQTDEEVGKVAQAVPIIIYILYNLYPRNKNNNFVLSTDISLYFCCLHCRSVDDIYFHVENKFLNYFYT